MATLLLMMLTLTSLACNCLLFIIIRPVTDVHVMLNKIEWERRVRQNVAKEGLSVIYTFR